MKSWQVETTAYFSAAVALHVIALLVSSVLLLLTIKLRSRVSPAFKKAQNGLLAALVLFILSLIFGITYRAMILFFVYNDDLYTAAGARAHMDLISILLGRISGSVLLVCFGHLVANLASSQENSNKFARIASRTLHCFAALAGFLAIVYFAGSESFWRRSQRDRERWWVTDYRWWFYVNFAFAVVILIGAILALAFSVVTARSARRSSFAPPDVTRAVTSRLVVAAVLQLLPWGWGLAYAIVALFGWSEVVYGVVDLWVRCVVMFLIYKIGTVSLPETARDLTDKTMGKRVSDSDGHIHHA